MYSNLPFMYMYLFMLIFGTFFSVSSEFWFGVWVGLELNLIGFLPILVYEGGSMGSEAGIKYFIVQALGSSLLIFSSLLGFGISFLWGLFSDFILSYGWGFLVLASLMIKIGAFPFHFWLPGVMGSLTWLSCMLLATWQKIAPCMLFMGVFPNTFDSELFSWLLCFFMIGGALVGGIGGLNQTQVRVLLSYSSIGHMAWVLASVWCAGSLMLFYLFVYIFITLSIFVVFWYMNMSFISQMNLFLVNTFSFLSVGLFLTSLGGLPPFLGFIPKLFVVKFISDAGLWFVLVFLFFGSLISLFYYLSLFFVVFLNFKKFMGSAFVTSSLYIQFLSFGVVINVFSVMFVVFPTVIGYALNFFYKS